MSFTINAPLNLLPRNPWITPKTALISVSDKTGLLPFAQFLHGQGIHILSTGGTAKSLEDAGIPVQDVASYTGSPEMMDGRVKTLNPKVHGGILSLRENIHHQDDMKTHHIQGIDLVVVNLYPFEATIATQSDYSQCVENIDIGGPAMIRAAAKNHGYVTVITDPSDYTLLIEEMTTNEGKISLELRKKLSARAFSRTASYDTAISQWMNKKQEETSPSRFNISGVRRQTLRYGENPHQQATFYTTGENRFGVATALQLQGKELSYNNIHDTDAAYELIGELGTQHPACVIVKHANPCGVAQGSSLIEAYEKALACDPVSAFGGIIAFNQCLDKATAEKITQIFTEVIIAPEVTEDARDVIAKKANLRLLVAGGIPSQDQEGISVKTVAGGLLVQNRDIGRIEQADLKIVTKRHPTEKEIQDLLFAFRVAKHVKSNAIVYVKNGATVGIGAGQMSRLDSSRIAARKALDAAEALKLDIPLTAGSVVASDAFFPFADGLIAAADAGVTAVIQPGGSMRDAEVIAAADERGLAMVFTGMRHFRH
jgi:phosphoribosylaminoimidazolecarboxamide formyltransferase / IMP cyclohydrolase